MILKGILRLVKKFQGKKAAELHVTYIMYMRMLYFFW